jgi:threonine dehydratase
MTAPATLDLAGWLEEIERARGQLPGLAIRTPLVDATALSAGSGSQVLLKPEFMQPAGSFKVRGAANKLRLVAASRSARGVVTFSTGNHGRAVAWVAARLGLAATVCVSERVPADKVEVLQRLGAEVVVSGASQDEAGAVARELATTRGLAMVHPFDDPAVIAGQGTIGLELVEDRTDLAAVVVPLSGGGLLGGIAAALKGSGAATRVIGVTLASGAMAQSLRSGRPIEIRDQPTVADSLTGGIGLDNAHTLSLVRDYVDEVIELDEDALRGGVAAALRAERYVLEAAGAAPIAALTTGRVPADGPVALILTGRQISLRTLSDIMQTHGGWSDDA